VAQDVVTGFLDGDKTRGRPVGLGIDGTGALLIADDVGNTVWRVASADGSVVPEPIPTDRVSTETTSGDVQAEAGPVAPLPGAEPEAATPAEAGAPSAPSPTDVAPAVSPEDGVPAPEGAQ
jgi:hypothetical protein